jgi:hypothetical protein
MCAVGGFLGWGVYACIHLARVRDCSAPVHTQGPALALHPLADSSHNATSASVARPRPAYRQQLLTSGTRLSHSLENWLTDFPVSPFRVNITSVLGLQTEEAMPGTGIEGS